MYIAYDENIHPELKKYFSIAKAIAGQFGNQCEVVIHDTSDYHSSIVAMFGNVTGRQLYAPLTNVIIEILNEKGDDAEDIVGYISYYKGQPFRNSTIFIRDENEKIIGCLCINYCVQDFFALKQITEQLTNSRSVSELKSEAKEEYFAQNVDDFVEYNIQKTLEKQGGDLTKLSKEERINLIRDLEEKGIFLVKGTVELIAERMNMSKYTIYNYIDVVKSKHLGVK